MIRDIIAPIYESRIVSILRGINESKVNKTVKALYDGGIRVVEITLDTPGALRMIEKVKIAYGDKMSIGAGSALDSETTRAAILSGADFVLSPTLSVEMIEMCNQYSKLAVPGVLTPTEVLTAWKAGAQIVKVFPARTFGPDYIKDIKGPLSQVEVMPVGGVSLECASEFIEKGAIAIGVGSELVNKTLVQEGNFEKITQKSIAFLEKVKNVRR